MKLGRVWDGGMLGKEEKVRRKDSSDMAGRGYVGNEGREKRDGNREGMIWGGEWRREIHDMTSIVCLGKRREG